MAEITIKVFVGGEEVQRAQPTPQVSADTQSAAKEAVAELQAVLDKHKWLTKPILPVELMSLKRKLEALLK